MTGLRKPQQLKPLARSRAILLSLLVAAGIGWLLWSGLRRDPFASVGMTRQPCTREGEAIFGGRQGDWARLCVYRAEDARLRASGIRPRAVLIGDSLTEYWLKYDMPLFGDVLVNRGIAGQSSAQLLVRFGQDAAALRPRVVHILVGSNDIAGTSGPNAPGMYQAHIRAMADIAQANGIAVILGTIPPVREFPWRKTVRPGNWTEELNRWLRGFARERGYVLADYHAAMATKAGGFDPRLYEDGAHPGAAGYAVMRRVLLDAIAAAEAKPAPAGPPRVNGSR